MLRTLTPHKGRAVIFGRSLRISLLLDSVRTGVVFFAGIALLLFLLWLLTGQADAAECVRFKCV